MAVQIGFCATTEMSLYIVIFELKMCKFLRCLEESLWFWPKQKSQFPNGKYSNEVFHNLYEILRTTFSILHPRSSRRLVAASQERFLSNLVVHKGCAKKFITVISTFSILHPQPSQRLVLAYWENFLSNLGVQSDTPIA